MLYLYGGDSFTKEEGEDYQTYDGENGISVTYDANIWNEPSMSQEMCIRDSLYTGLHRVYTIAANHVICYGDKVRDILYKELESRNTNMNTTIRAMTPADKDSVMEMMRVFYNSPAVLSNGSDEIFARDIEGCVSDNPYVEGYRCV